MKLFKMEKRETDEEIADRIHDLCVDGDYGIISPPLNPQVALDELCRYFLGEDWYCVDPISVKQSNTLMVIEMEEYRKGKSRSEERHIILNRVLNLCEDVDCGAFVSPLDPQVAVNELCRYFLGEDWNTSSTLSELQINTVKVINIEQRYRGRKGKKWFFMR